MSDAIGEKTIQAAQDAVGECLRERLSDLNRTFDGCEDALKVGVKLMFGYATDGHHMGVRAKLSLNLGKVEAESEKWAKEGE